MRGSGRAAAFGRYAMQNLLGGDKHPMFGKILSEEIKEKMRIAKLGKSHFGFAKALTDEHKASRAIFIYFIY